MTQAFTGKRPTTMDDADVWTPQQNTVIASLAMLSSSASILGAGSIVHAVARTLLSRSYGGIDRNPAAPNLVALLHLCSADLIAATATLVLGAFGALDRDNTGVYYRLCVYALGLPVHIAYQTTFWLTFAYAVQMYMSTRGRGASGTMFALRLACWTLPIFVTTFGLVAASQTVTQIPINWCNEVSFGPMVFIRGATELLYIPLLVAFISVAFIYFALYREYAYTMQQLGDLTDSDKREMRRVMLQLLAYVGVFCVCWFANVIELIMLWAAPHLTRNDYFPIFVLQALLNPAQGFFNSIVYGYSNRHLMQVTHTPTVVSLLADQ